jgi:mannonate dehydratase
MKIGLVITPFDETNLRLAAQIGVEEIVYYDMYGLPNDPGELLPVVQRVHEHGMKMTVAEGGPPNNDIVLGKAGRESELENYKRCLDAMSKAGLRVLCYNFMPLSLRVVRTSFETAERGGARTNSFEAAQWDNSRLTRDGITSDEQIWENLEWFLRRIIPAAEAAEIKLAMHPDDPPISPMCGLARIMRSVENFQRLIDLVPSPCNGITLCQGCFSEMRADIPAVIRQFKDRINFVHFRDTIETANGFRETFHDNGRTDMFAAMQAYKEIGYTGVARPDHVPALEGEEGPAHGYTMKGRLFAVGYMRGLMHAARLGNNVPRSKGRAVQPILQRES